MNQRTERSVNLLAKYYHLCYDSRGFEFSDKGGLTMTDRKHDADYEKKQQDLYARQVEVLHKFLERGAISREQYDKSYACLKDTFEKKGG